MKSIFALIVLISLYNYILCVDFQDCSSSDGKFISAEVAGCSDSDTSCPFKSGANVSMKIKFTSNVDSSTNTVKLWGIIGGVSVPFPANPSDACKMGLSCPVSKGSSQEVTFSVLVASSYPKISLNVKGAVVDSNGNNLVCVQYPAHIV